MAGQMYTLICNGTLVGNTSLTPVVTWRNSTGVVASGNDITVSNGILTFNSLRISHGGQYTCQSVVTSVNTSTATANTNVIVQSKTSLINNHISVIIQLSSPVPTPNVTVTATLLSPSLFIGGNLTLTCNILLDPSVDSTVMVNSTWTGPGGRGYNETAPVKNGSFYQNIITLVYLTPEDIGSYNCSVSVTPINSLYIISATGSAITQGIDQP